MKNIEYLLAESFHRKLTKDEKFLLEKELKNNEEAKKEKNELNRTLEILDVYSPAFSNDFAGKVMDRLFGQETEIQMLDLFPVFKKILLGGLVATLALVFSIYITDGSFNADTILGLSDINSEELILTLLNF